MNVTDLRELLDDRSADPRPDLVSPTRLSDVRGRIARRRRRRALVAIAAAAVAVLGGTVTAVVLPRAYQVSPTGPPAPSPARTVEGFPEYADGARVVAAAVSRPGQDTITLTATPGDVDLVLFTRCSGTAPTEHQLSVNRRPVASGTGCGGGSVRPQAKTMVNDYGVRPGQPMTVTFTMKGPVTGEFAVAVGQRVDPAVYPYPPRPATLRPLQQIGSTRDGADAAGRGGRVLRADPADPNRPVRLTLTWPSGGAAFASVAQTPGALRITVNGALVEHEEWWDYQQTQHGGLSSEHWKGEGKIDPKPGQQVTVTVAPERMTGQWQVLIDPQLPGR
ncbi:MAG TPA: hypothetical protein VF755_21185 [Catenuloplanes sp.]|jgi:hypothetical protein